MAEKKIITIKCPNCRTEYLPEEIYVPTGFFGKPQCIERTYDGRVDSFEGRSLDTRESYVCDCCGELFDVDAHISFSTSSTQVSDISKPYLTKLKVNPGSLFEDILNGDQT